MILLRLFLAFVKIGFVGFGGGLAILPLIYQAANNFVYMSNEEFANLFAISQSTPGPIAINAATFVGYHVAGIPGAIVATLGVSAPAFILVIIVCRVLMRFYESKPMKGALQGIRPAALGLIGSAILVVGQGAIFYEELTKEMSFSDIISDVNVVALIMAVLSFVLCAKFKVGIIKVILIMAVLGAIFCSGFISI